MEDYKKDDTIQVTTKYGKDVECIIFNNVLRRDEYNYYSVVRADGFNRQEWAKRRAEKISNAAARAEAKSNQYYEASKEGADFLVLAEPIKVGHHSEKKHRALIERNYNRMAKCVDFSNKAEELNSRISYWENQAQVVNLSMPESLEVFEELLIAAKERHEGLLNKTIEREHSYSLAYSSKNVKELEKKCKVAQTLWG